MPVKNENTNIAAQTNDITNNSVVNVIDFSPYRGINLNVRLPCLTLKNFNISTGKS